MAQGTPPPTGRGTGDALAQSSQALGSLTAQRVGATAYPLGLPAGNPLFDNPWNIIAPNTMPIPSLNATATLPFHGAQRNSADVAQFGIPAPQCPRPSQPEDKAVVENAGATAQQPAKVIDQTADPEEEVSSDELSDVQTSDGSDSRLSSESDGDLDRQDKYAFSHTSQAYEHRIPQNLTGGITLFTEKVCMGTSIHQHLDQAEKQGIPNKHPTLVPHDLEMKPAPKATKCIWVGMLPAVLQDGEDDTAEAQAKGVPKVPSKRQMRAKKAQSLIDLEDDQLDIVPHDPKALRVVAKVQTKQVNIWHLYALATSDTGSRLCQGWKVPSDEVFFFRAFRDDTVTGAVKRRRATELKIKAVIFPRSSAPAVVPQSSVGSEHASSPAPVSDPVTTTTGNLPSPESFEKKERPSRTLRTATANQASKGGEPLVQKDDQAGSPANGDTRDKSLVADRQSPAVDHRDHVSLGDDGGEDAYPEHAVSSSDTDFKSFLDNMVGDLRVAELEGGELGQKRKRVAFDTGCDEVANTRRKMGGSSRSNKQVGDGEDGGFEPSSFVVGEQIRRLALNLKNKVDKLVAGQDLAGLRQCDTLMGCIEQRGRPSPNSALAPYLSISSKKDADPQACNGKLREILDLFPELENVDGLDNNVLAFMVRGLRTTGQSIEVGLIEACIKSFSHLYKQKYGDNRPTNMAKSDLIDMICEARDDAEKMLKKNPLKQVRVPHYWVDPRYNPESVGDE